MRISAGAIELEGNLSVVEGAQGVVLFAHGSGSGRSSPRNLYVADEVVEPLETARRCCGGMPTVSSCSKMGPNRFPYSIRASSHRGMGTNSVLPPYDLLVTSGE